MSCGNPHDTDCREVLARVYGYLDGELDSLSCDEVRQHLEECGPCLRQFDLEAMVKSLVARSCACQPVPDQVRARVVARLTEIRVSYARLDVRDV